MAATTLSAADLPERPQQITRVVRADPRTGKLVRSVVVNSKSVAARPVVAQTIPSAQVLPAQTAADTPAPPPLPADFDAALEHIAAEHSLHPLLMRSVIKVESNYNPFAVSPKGAMGLMQLMPETAARFHVRDVFNPVENMRGGAQYLRFLLDLYHEDYQLALAAYNAGEQAVEKYGTVPPYPETRTYVYLVAREIDAERKAAESAVRLAAAPARFEEPRPAEPHIRETVDSAGIVHYVTR